MGMQRHALIETVKNAPPVFDFKLSSRQVLLALTAWLGTAGLVKEDLKVPLERPVIPVRRARQASRAIARRRCVWPPRHTPPRGYRKRERLKDPMSREPSHDTRRRERRRGTERPAFSQWGNIEDQGCGTAVAVTGRTAPSSLSWEVSNHHHHDSQQQKQKQQQLPSTHTPLNPLMFFGRCRCQSHLNSPALFHRSERSRCTRTLHLLVSHRHEKVIQHEPRGAERWWTLLSCPATVTLRFCFVCFSYAIICLRCVLKLFFFFNAVPLLRHRSRCLESVQRKGPINDWSLNSQSVLYCIVKVFFICKLEWNPQMTSCVHPPHHSPFLQPLITPALYPSLILETNDQLYLFLLLPGNGISRWALPSPTMQCCKSL